MNIDNIKEQEDYSTLIGCESALSPGVRNLLCSFGTGVWAGGRGDDDEGQCQNGSSQAPVVLDTEHIFLHENGLLNVEGCSCFLELNEDADRDSSYYAKAAFKLSPTFRECEQIWSEIELDEFSIQCKQYLKWTGKEQLFLDCYKMLKQRSENQHVLALLLLSTGIEQCLRNIFVLENEQCPMLLKDILASKEVEQYIGKAAAQLLQILLGPPISMNLRNVVWHGFLSEGEISPRYTYFLLILIVSLGADLSSREFVERSVNPKQYFPLSKVDCIRNSFQDLPDGMLENIRESVICSWVAGARNKRLINDVFDLHAEKKYGFSSMQGFPILEHALRRRFVKVNDCPQRLLTAEATTLYTTFEEILGPYLPDSQKNRLIEDLGVPFMDLLHDLLIYPSGPRARDRLGHGEADVYDAPPSLSLMIIVCLCFLSTKGGEVDNDSIEVDLPIQDLVASVNNYESQFHPVMELKGKIHELSLKSTQIHNCLRTDPDLQPWTLDSSPESFTKDNSTFHCITPLLSDLLCHSDKHKLWDLSVMKSKLSIPFEHFHDAIAAALRPRVSTLHRWQSTVKCQESNVTESEIISLMHRVLTEMSTVLDQMETAIEQRQEAIDNRLLRSRQRDNTKRLISLFPNTILAVNYLSILWTWLFRLLNQPDKNLSPFFKKIQKFLKSTLKSVENLRTCTSKDNNKWTKAEEIIVIFIRNGVEVVHGLDV